MQNNQLTSARIDIVDALRGFALLGILLVHFLEQYYAGPPPAGHENYTVLHPFDQVLDGMAGILLRGKFFMLFAFLLLARRGWWQRQLLKLAPFGRMALTNYIAQSLIGTAVVFGYGFGLLGDVGSTFMLILGVAVFILQRVGSDWWLRHYYYGPVEWLWRSATLWKWQKFRRT